jgi:hypothetical protein
MKDYKFKVVGHCVKEITVEAQSEEEARDKLNSGDWINDKELIFEDLRGIELLSVEEF